MRYFVLFILVFQSLTSLGRDYVNFRRDKRSVVIEVTDGEYHFSAYSSRMVETTFYPKGKARPAASTAVVLKEKQLFSAMVFSIIDQKQEKIELQTTGIKISINKKPFSISYYYGNKALVTEAGGYQKTAEGEQIEFAVNREEVLYGAGARALPVNRRGERLQLYNRAHYGYETESKLMNYCLPIVQSSNGYMLHFDNGAIGWLDFDSRGDDRLRYETIGGRMTYQVIAAPNWADILSEYTRLTGRQPLPPRWVLGNFASRFGYHSEREVRETVAAFRTDSIPIDAVVIDIYWFGKDIQGHMGNLEFLADSFPTPDNMLAEFSADGIQTVLVTEPFILSTSDRWEEAVQEKVLATNDKGEPFRYDFYFGNTGLIDLTDTAAREWFWGIYRSYTRRGVGGWWGDLGEPEVHPSALRHKTGTADEIHNIYGHLWASLIADGYKRDFPKQRPFILMRAGGAGSQRYGLIPWSGDVSRSWGGLQSQPGIALSMGMQGLGWMQSDLGGFAGGDKFDPELYTRWLQYGVFQPVFRPHAQEHIAPEPVFHDAATKALAKKAIELRYRLLPYNYQLAFENQQTGLPLMRPLWLTGDSARAIDTRSYQWGKAFLVSPILKPGVKDQTFYLPAGHWFDFYTDSVLTGGTEQRVATRPDGIPTYVKAGSFVAMAEPMQHTGQYNSHALELHYYHHASVPESTDSLYDDDGRTPDAYATGQYELLYFEAEDEKSGLEIEIDRKPGTAWTVKPRELEMVIHGLKQAPQSVKLGRKRVKHAYDNGVLRFKVKVSEPETELFIKYGK